MFEMHFSIPKLKQIRDINSQNFISYSIFTYINNHFIALILVGRKLQRRRSSKEVGDKSYQKL